MENNQQNNGSEYVVTFRNGALLKLKELAGYLNIPEENLGEVILKGMKLIDTAKDGKIIIEKGKDKFEVDIKRL